MNFAMTHKHLRCGHDRLAGSVALFDHHLRECGKSCALEHKTETQIHTVTCLLCKENLLSWDLHAKVTSCNHDTIACGENLVEIDKTLLILHLTDDLDVLASVTKHTSDILDIFALADKGCGNEVNIVGNAEIDKVRDVFVGQGWKVNLDAGQVDILALADGGAVSATGAHGAAEFVAAEHLEVEGAIGDEDMLPRLDITREIRIAA
jgi:hypothetical protein